MTSVVTDARLPRIAEVLDTAARTASPVSQVTDAEPLTLAEAYAVQHLVVGRRITRGERSSGVKLGFTSRAKAQQMGVDDVIIGSITHQMAVADGGQVNLTRYIHPRIEPEVAFLLGIEVDPYDEAADVEASVVAVAPALEIIDSRYRDFRFTLADVVADNTSAAGYVLGPWVARANAGDLGNRGVRLEAGGRLVESGSTAAILGHPIRALHAAKRMARQHGFTLPAGTVLLAGAATAAVPLTAGGSVVAHVTGLGGVGVTVSTPGSPGE